MTTYDVEIVVPEDCGIKAAGETVTLEVDGSEYVLAAARAAGAWLPADCQQGWCTTCAGELLAGEVDQTHARRYYDVDGDAGLILTCTARPRSDLVVRACQHDAMLEQRQGHRIHVFE